ncbi:helix-turn-helix domain-containing protein [Streptomyces sp. NBC_01775]|uniref:helix-turn-helix domain-containing protein n=1 Tax=Streptomyces sp. NBC_01775 TaxID=2975939 RepID=UPI002DDBC6A6|nr:hypothetical protein [Streptomyces sp. NBC_01775]WSB74798.1 helix-turn-helix domain-containing protein [Streptomyces sp. NBC_01775]
MPSHSQAADLKRLADLVIQRRTQLGQTKVAVARTAGITITTYSQVEAGQSVRDSTYGKLEPALGWASGSCREVLRGDDPVLTAPGENGAIVSPLTAEDLQGAVEQAVQNAAIATTDLPASEIRKVKQRVIEELRRAGKLPKTDRD